MARIGVCARGVVQDVHDVARLDTEITQALRAAVAEKVGQDRFDLWFGAKTQFCGTEQQQLLVEVATPFFRDFLRKNFRAEIESACADVLGARDVQFCVNAELGSEADEPQADVALAKTAQSADSDPAPSPRAGKNRSAPENSKAPSPNGRASRRRVADFDSFVSGHSNRVAHATAQTVAEEPGSVSPLFLYGGTGVGKTHLLESIWRFAGQLSSAALYLSAEQFTSLFLEALHRSGLPNFRRKYRSVEVLIIDDIHFFSGKKATIGELLHTIDTLLRNGRQIVLAADRPPAEIDGLGPELTSRVSGGMVCRLDPPDQPTRRKIVERYAESNKIRLPEEVQAFIASRFTDHVRALFGAVHRLHATSRALGEPITLKSAEEALADLIPGAGRSLGLREIEKAVCNVFGLQSDSLRGQRKVKAVSHPRMLAMWLARKHTRSALSEIGDYFGRRSHTTVISAQKRVNGWVTAGAPVELANQRWNVEEAIRRVEDLLKVG